MKKFGLYLQLKKIIILQILNLLVYIKYIKFIMRSILQYDGMIKVKIKESKNKLIMQKT